MITNMSDITYCEDCKHKAPIRLGVYESYCSRPELAGPNALVSRSPAAWALPKCAEMRGNNLKCGSAGVFFEAKPKPTPRRKWWQFWL